MRSHRTLRWLPRIRHSPSHPEHHRCLRRPPRCPCFLIVSECCPHQPARLGAGVTDGAGAQSGARSLHPGSDHATARSAYVPHHVHRRMCVRNARKRARRRGISSVRKVGLPAGLAISPGYSKLPKAFPSRSNPARFFCALEQTIRSRRDASGNRTDRHSRV